MQPCLPFCPCVKGNAVHFLFRVLSYRRKIACLLTTRVLTIVVARISKDLILIYYIYIRSLVLVCLPGRSREVLFNMLDWTEDQQAQDTCVDRRRPPTAFLLMWFLSLADTTGAI